jgi:chromosome segregation ATPase
VGKAASDKEKDAAIKQKDEAIDKKAASDKEKDAAIKEKDEAINERYSASSKYASANKKLFKWTGSFQISVSEAVKGWNSRNTEISRLKRENDQLEKGLTESKNDCSSKEALLAAERARVGRRDKTIQDQTATIDGLEEDLQTAKTSAKRDEDSSKAAREQLDATIKGLRADKVSRDETIKTRETALAISEAKIVELREFITAKTGLIQELRGEYRDLASRLATLGLACQYFEVLLGIYWKRSQDLDLGLQSATEEKANLESA